MIIKSEQEMLDFGTQFAEWTLHGRVTPLGGPPAEPPRGWGKLRRQDPPRESASIIELLGDVGTGKTTFTRGLAKGLKIKDKITSPSFTISKSYALPTGGNLIHYDFYRLDDPGLLKEDLIENLKNPQNIIVIEWGESVKNLLPKNHTTIKIDYKNDDSRKVTIK